MTTRFWNSVPVLASGSRTAASFRPWSVLGWVLFLGVLLAAPAGARAQTLGNFCLGTGTCDITNPRYVNVYWDSSLAQWDTDVASVTSDMGHDHVDHLTEALIHSQYFAALTQYSVTSPSFGGSLSASGCLAAPSALDTARSDLNSLVNCLLLLHPWLNTSNTILNVFVPPQSMPVPGICSSGLTEIGEHGQYWTSVGVTFLPTNSACGGSLAALFGVTTHEMVEATTDPNPPSPTGWKDGTPGDFYGQEAGDLCELTSSAHDPYLFASVSTYWSDALPGCTPGFALSTPSVTTATACGTGQNMTLRLTGSFGAVPWDLASGKFGTQTLYLNARITHLGQVWEAGNFEGLPNDSVNQGHPDAVTFGAGGVSWSPGTIIVSGFGTNYGQIMGNGARAEVAPGDPIAVKLALNDSGQFTTANITAPQPSQILNLTVTPRAPDAWIFVNRQADVNGVLADPGLCAVQGQSVAFLAFQGSVTPGLTTSSAAGQFPATYNAPGVAGVQTVRAALWSNSSVNASASVPVHPILNSVTPDLGPVGGGQSATLAGDGFDPADTKVSFGGAGAKVGAVALQSIQVATPHSPLGGDGDGTVDVIASVHSLDSLGVPYHYVLPGKPYLSLKSTSCNKHYIVVTVYDNQGQPVTVPIQLTAGYPAYFSNPSWVASMSTTSGTWVQVDKGGPFTATNTNNNLSNTASFPILPGPICFNVRNITRVDWHIFEKPGDLTPQEVSQLNPAARAGLGGKKVVVWTTSPKVENATNYVQDPAGTAGGGGLRVGTVGQEQLRGVIHGQIFLSGGTGGLKTESATGQPGGNVLEVRFAGPAFSVTRAGQPEDAAAPLGRELRLTFGLPQGWSNPHVFHIVHLTRLDGQPTWVEDGKSQLFPYNSGITRTIEQSGIYALIEEMGTATETPQTQEQKQEQPQPQQPQQPQPAPQGSTVLVPNGAFPGGVLTGVVLGPDDKPVPNTPVNIAGGVPITLTGVVIGEEEPSKPQPPSRPQPCQPDAAGNLPPGCPPAPTKPQPPARQVPCQPDAAGNLPAGCAPPTVSQPSDCVTVLKQFAGTAVTQAVPAPPAGAAPTAIGGTTGGVPQLLTDANGRFAMCVPVDAPKVDVALPGAPPQSVPGIRNVKERGARSQPPTFFQPNDRVDVIGVLRDPAMQQGGQTWQLPVVQAISPDGQQTLTAFKTPRELAPGPVKFSFTDPSGRPREFTGGVFKILSATLDRSKLRSQEGADFEYTVQFGGAEHVCVNVTVAGPVVLVQAPPPEIPVDASGIGKFGGKIRATQVAPGAAIPFDIRPDITNCGGTAPSPQGGEAQPQTEAGGSTPPPSPANLQAAAPVPNPGAKPGEEVAPPPAAVKPAAPQVGSTPTQVMDEKGASKYAKAPPPLYVCSAVNGTAPAISNVVNSNMPPATYTQEPGRNSYEIHGCNFGKTQGHVYLIFPPPQGQPGFGTPVELYLNSPWASDVLYATLDQNFGGRLDQDGLTLEVVTGQGAKADRPNQKFRAWRVSQTLQWFPQSQLTLGSAGSKWIVPVFHTTATSETTGLLIPANTPPEPLTATVSRSAAASGPFTVQDDLWNFSQLQPGFTVLYATPYYDSFSGSGCDQTSGHWGTYWDSATLLRVHVQGCYFKTGTGNYSSAFYGLTIVVMGPKGALPWPTTLK